MKQVTVDPNCMDSIRAAAKALSTSVEAIQQALAEFGRKMAQVGHHAIAGAEILAEELRELKRMLDDEPLPVLKERPQSVAHKWQTLTIRPTRPIQLQSSYG